MTANPAGTQRRGSLLRDGRVQGLAGGVVLGFLIGLLIFGKPWGLPPAWGDIPTWLLVILAAVGGWVALSQLREQQDVIKRDADDRRIAQAARIFIGVDRDRARTVRPYAKNASDLPVYDAQSWYSRAGKLDGPVNLDVILPDEEPYAGPARSGRDALAGTILTFRDANNARWVRMPDGTLHHQSRPDARESILAIVSRAGTGQLPAAPTDPGTTTPPAPA